MDLTAQIATGKQATHHEFLPLRLRRASYTRTSPDYLFWHMLATCARARALFFDGENSLGLNWN